MFSITEDDINQWASHQHNAENVLPDLVRRIIYALVPEAKPVFGAYKATKLEGYDGELMTPDRSLFAGTTASVWELSIRSDITTKANEDYDKRTAEPGAIDPSRTTYITLTGRRWSTKGDWCREKQAEGKWADVRAYDAIDIAQWLTQSPSVAIWFQSEILGRPIDGTFSLEQYFNQWSYRTQPPISASIASAGRENELQIFTTWLRSSNKILRMRAETLEECAVFSCAAILTTNSPEREDWLARALVVTDEQAWQRIIRMVDRQSVYSPLILIPNFEQFDGSTYITRHHYLVLPSESGQPFQQADIILQPISRNKLAEKLLEMEPNQEKARNLAYDSGGKILALQRLLGYSYRPPKWLGQASSLDMGLLLVGTWLPGNEHDQKILLGLCAVQDYDQIERRAYQLMNTTDAPLRKQGEAIKWRSIRDVWGLLGTNLTRSDLQRFRDICISVLKVPHPRYDLPLEERIFAEIRGHTLSISGYIRRGLSETLAWLYIFSASFEKVLGSNTVTSVVDQIVWAVLDSDWRVWASLGDLLSNLAEASPEQFLRSIEAALQDPDKHIEQLFKQDPKGSGMSAESAHSGLLWALEVLAWNQEYYPRVAMILADLCKIDEGGQYANRPEGSLISLFHPLSKQTTASKQQRADTLRVVCRRHPELAWHWLQHLLGICSRGGVVMPNSRPKYHDNWTLPQTFEHYSDEEADEICQLFHDLIVEKLQKEPERAIDLLENYEMTLVEVDCLDIVEKKLEQFQKSDFQTRSRLQNALRKRIAFWYHHKNNKEAFVERIARAQQLIDKLDSPNLAEKYAWMFEDRFITLPDPVDWDIVQKQQKLIALRGDAIRELVQANAPLQQLINISNLSKNPRLVGLVFGQTNEAEAFKEKIITDLLAQGNVEQELALGFIAARHAQQDTEWYKSVIQNLISDNKFELASAALTTVTSTPEVRDFIKQQPADLYQLYWQNVKGIFNDIRDDQDFSEIIRGLLNAKRWDLVIQLAAWAVDNEPPVGQTSDYLGILDYGRQTTQDEVNTIIRNNNDWYISRIFKYLDDCDGVDKNHLAGLEVLYIDLLDRSERPPKYITQQIEQSPEFFTELVIWAFKARSEEQADDQIGDEEKAELYKYANVASRIRRAWHGYPGIDIEDEDERNKYLREWCDKVLELTANADRKVIGEQMVGEVLSRVPTSSQDGIWPCLVAREYIETGKNEIAIGLRIARYNARGVVSRALGAGGEQERIIARKYRENAEILQNEWVRTAAFLKEIAMHYERETAWEDKRAEGYNDP